MLCSFQVYRKVNLLYVQPLFFRFFPHTGYNGIWFLLKWQIIVSLAWAVAETFLKMSKVGLSKQLTVFITNDKFKFSEVN